jgi:hypothetical protein
MARRKVDVSMLQDLMTGAEGQEVSRGSRLTTDPNFPVFQTPVNEDILVYIPRTNVVSSENGETMRVLESHIHDYKKGQSFGRMRCINGLAGTPAYDALGFDGTCPACEAVSECWDLYNKKLAVEAERLGVDPQNDPSNILKTVKETLRGEMDMKSSVEYVTFPIVIIPQKAKMIAADDAQNNLKVVFVTWRKKRYEDSILAALDTLRNNPGHPAGMFWYWKFTYNTEGKQANARDAALNAKYSPITDAADLQYLVAPCEEKAKDFTLLKATEVIVANQFMYKEDMVEEVDKIMSKTRTFLELSGSGAGAATAIPASTNPLANFGGQIPEQTTPVTQPVTGDLGVAPQAPQTSQIPQAPSFGGSPVKFGN